MEHPKAVGDRCTLAVMMALQALGLPFSVPFGENTRYDLVIDEGDRLARVQCKSGRLRNGAAVYLVPIADVPTITQACLRVEPARNNQRFGVRPAKNYEIARVAYAPTAALAASAGAG
jgi:hypothetical protein